MSKNASLLLGWLLAVDLVEYRSLLLKDIKQMDNNRSKAVCNTFYFALIESKVSQWLTNFGWTADI